MLTPAQEIKLSIALAFLLLTGIGLASWADSWQFTGEDVKAMHRSINL